MTLSDNKSTALWWAPLALLLIAAITLAVRVQHLADRPMHGDEAIQADKFASLWQTGMYVYDPAEYHGPTLNYLTLPAMWLSGARDYAATTEATFRVVPVAFGVGLILLLCLVRDGLGAGETVCAAALTAISPAMTFYSRYYIHETLLVFFSFAAIATAWRYARTGRAAWCIACGISVGLMFATKETWIISALSMGASLVMSSLWTRLFDVPPLEPSAPPPAPGHLRGALSEPLGWKPPLVALLLGAALAALLFSGFFTSRSGLRDSILAYTHYLGRGTGAGEHNHPFHYYLGLLAYWRYGRGPIRSEALILALATVGAVASLWRSRNDALRATSLPRFLTFYTLTMILLYSAIPYKTPWCMIGFLHGMILLAGVGSLTILRHISRRAIRPIAAACLIVAGGQLAWQAYQISFVHYADNRRNPYIYSQPSKDILRLIARIQELAAVPPQGTSLRIRVITADCWPIPWYLRGFAHVEYWNGPTAHDADASIIIASPDMAAPLTERLGDRYRSEYYGLRPQVLLALFADRALWDEMVQRRTR